MVSICSRNKARGRAFQAKLAEMVGGINVGTLGGEDVMHEEFSYEAKTYNPKAKSHKGMNWTGEKWMSYFERSVAIGELVFCNIHKSKFPGHQVILEVNTTDSKEPIVLMRWSLWDEIDKFKKIVSIGELVFCNIHKPKFQGRTYMRQAEKNCPDGKIPVVVVHTTGKRHKTDIVLIYRVYWNSLLQKLHLTKAFK